MKIIITEEQYKKLNKSNQKITNAITKYMNEYISNGNRKVTPKARAYGNHFESWCIGGKNTLDAAYYFENGNFEKGVLSVSKNIIDNLSKLLSVRRSYVLHVIEEWYDETMVPKFEEIVGESGLTISQIDVWNRDNDCVPEPVKPEGITDEEMIDYIANNTAYSREDVVDRIESGKEDLDDMFLHITDIQNRKKITGF